MSTGQKRTNEKSLILSDIENQDMFTALGPRCTSMSTAFVWLYLADVTNKQEWYKYSCVVVCFVRDNPRRSYFIRLFDRKTREMLWEQKLYTKFAYTTTNEHFHYFNAHDCLAGLSFFSRREAAHFKKTVDGWLMERLKKHMERRKQRPAKSGNIGRSNQPYAIKKSDGHDTRNEKQCEISNDLPLVDRDRIKNIADLVEKSGVIEALKQKMDLQSKLGQGKPSILPTVSRQNLQQKVPLPTAAIEKRHRMPTPPPEMEDKADVPPPVPVRRYSRRLPSPPPPKVGFQNKSPLSSERAISDKADVQLPLPVKKHFRPVPPPPPPEIGFQNESPLSSQGGISVSVKSADVVQLPQYVAGRRRVRPTSGERHILPSDKESPLDGISPGKANISSEMQNPLLQDCEGLDSEAVYESDDTDDSDNETGCDFVDEWSD